MFEFLTGGAPKLDLQAAINRAVRLFSNKLNCSPTEQKVKEPAATAEFRIPDTRTGFFVSFANPTEKGELPRMTCSYFAVDPSPSVSAISRFNGEHSYLTCYKSMGKVYISHIDQLIRMENIEAAINLFFSEIFHPKNSAQFKVISPVFK